LINGTFCKNRKLETSEEIIKFIAPRLNITTTKKIFMHGQ